MWLCDIYGQRGRDGLAQVQGVQGTQGVGAGEVPSWSEEGGVAFGVGVSEGRRKSEECAWALFHNKHFRMSWCGTAPGDHPYWWVAGEESGG